ncbi:MAG: PD40 domain-containing protein, partial [Spirochaetes bacterium]|nr:PD40 domain-containing protein [Spirochaetota bacterium]
PDLDQVCFPPNLAPPPFMIREKGHDFRVCLRGRAGRPVVFAAPKGAALVPRRAWRELVDRTPGGRIQLEVYVRHSAGPWRRFAPVFLELSTDPIDPYLAYRILGPAYHLWNELGLFQRHLETYEERPILRNRAIGHACINCHAFDRGRPDHFSFQFRPGSDRSLKPGLVFVGPNGARRIDTRTAQTPQPPAYLSWSPGGALAVFSMNHIGQVIRSAAVEPRDVFDLASELAVYDASSGEARPTRLSPPDGLATFPAWAPDGRMLYFCRAFPPWKTNQAPLVGLIDKVRYDLVRAPYDPGSRSWGAVETLVSAERTGLSASEPRVSPDGRFVLFCLSPWGAFPANQPGSDLWLLDLRDRTHRRLAVNSPEADSWHSWSQNGRWIVFSSKRDNGWLARPYFFHLDGEGRESKPFPLPQASPDHYDRFLKNYNLPEFMTGPVTVSEKNLAKAVGEGRPGDGTAHGASDSSPSPDGHE